MFHGSRRESAWRGSALALSLYQMLNRDGAPRFLDRRKLAGAFKIGTNVPLLLTGTAHDPPLERWWELGEQKRKAVIKALRNLDVALVTTPNYSLFTDVPRWDDLHAMKRIGIVYSEFIEQELPTALHINGRTDTDFTRWASFVAARPEVTHLAYEFTTGTGWPTRRKQHAMWLCDVARAADRPLELVVRGGIEVLPLLARSFKRVTYLDTSIFIKTMKRQQAVNLDPKRLSWKPFPTAADAPLDDLLSYNHHIVSNWLYQFLLPPRPVSA